MSEADDVREARIQIQNRHGLHARPAAEFVKLANTFQAEIRVQKDELEVNGKSIMGVMMLAAEYGCEITIRATGEESERALEALAALVQRRFGED